MEATLEDELLAPASTDAETPAPARAALDARALFEEHGAFVLRALRCLGVAEHEVADVGQEVFIAIQRRLSSFEHRASVRTWLYAICVRRALAHRRNAARRRESTVAEPPEPVAETSAATPEDEVARERALRLAIALLDG